MKRLGLHFAVRVDVITVGILCLAMSNVAFFYWRSHRPAPPCTSGVKEPTVEIGPITYFIPVPQPPKVIVKVVQAPASKPDVQVKPQEAQPTQENDQPPVSLTKRVVPDSLHHSIEEMNPWLVSANRSK